MAPTSIFLPNGQNLTVLPVFGGLFFKPNDLNIHNSLWPTGWTIVIQSEDYDDDHDKQGESHERKNETPGVMPTRHRHIHRYRQPTLDHDNLFISSVSLPSNDDFKAAASPTRQIAMMLWTTLYWYFHQPEPCLQLTTEASKHTPEYGRPKGEWRINIKREGVFSGRNLLPKLERMGLVTSEDSSVGVVNNGKEGWNEMFVSRRSFWQLSAKLFLFTLSPTGFPGSPYGSRPSSPVRDQTRGHSPKASLGHESSNSTVSNAGLWAPQTGPFASGSHLPTYYPPAPLQYTSSNGVRHPVRAKPPRQGETFYVRYIPSLGQHLSFRVASLSDQPVVYNGPFSPTSDSTQHIVSSIPSHVVPSSMTTIENPAIANADIETDTLAMSDTQLLHKWMNIERVSKFWGCSGPISVQEKFLTENLKSRHSFPAIGCWDGKPFGYFEIYWVKEDILGKLLNPGEVEDWDRGFHVLVGEEEFRGKHRLSRWVSALIHWSLCQDYRTNNVVLEPRVDNERFIQHLQDAGFSKEKEVSFPHKQSAYMRYRRETFDGPAL